jgi:hypothetical protein
MRNSFLSYAGICLAPLGPPEKVSGNIDTINPFVVVVFDTNKVNIVVFFKKTTNGAVPSGVGMDNCILTFPGGFNSRVLFA